MGRGYNEKEGEKAMEGEREGRIEGARGEKKERRERKGDGGKEEWLKRWTVRTGDRGRKGGETMGWSKPWEGIEHEGQRES